MTTTSEFTPAELTQQAREDIAMSIGLQMHHWREAAIEAEKYLESL